MSDSHQLEEELAAEKQGVFWRAIAIYWAITVALWGYIWGRLALVFVSKDEGWVERRARLRGRLLREGMTKLGATFIKLGQVMSSRPDLLEAGTIAELRLLQDKLPALPFERVRPEAEAQWGKPVGEAFAEFDTDALAAASVAQVHRGKLHDGSEVAIKIVRPDVRKNALLDGHILLALCRASLIFEAARHADTVSHMREFLVGILEQTDLRIEAKNYERFRENFADNDRVFFPHVHAHLSGEKVLTMEFVRGKKVDDPDVVLPDDIGKVLSRTFLKMVYEDGFLHADLHPGNFMLTDDGRIGVFDVGLAKKLSPEVMAQNLDFNRCLAVGTAEDYINHMKTFHQYIGEIDWDTLAKEVDELVSGFRGKANTEIEMGKIINQIFALGRKYNVRPIPEMTLIMVGIVTAEGVGKQINPDNDSFGQMGEFLAELMAKQAAGAAS